MQKAVQTVWIVDSVRFRVFFNFGGVGSKLDDIGSPSPVPSRAGSKPPVYADVQYTDIFNAFCRYVCEPETDKMYLVDGALLREDERPDAASLGRSDETALDAVPSAGGAAAAAAGGAGVGAMDADGEVSLTEDGSVPTGATGTVTTSARDEDLEIEKYVSTSASIVCLYIYVHSLCFFFGFWFFFSVWWKLLLCCMSGSVFVLFFCFLFFFSLGGEGRNETSNQINPFNPYGWIASENRLPLQLCSALSGSQ